MARQRAGLTQRQLAYRSGYPRESIVRWERGSQEPSFATLSDVVRAAGLDLVPQLTRRDDSLRELAHDQLARDPAQRLRGLVGPARYSAAKPAAAFRLLARSPIPLTLIGAVAGVLQGDPQQPPDLAPTFVSDDAEAMATHVESLGYSPMDDEDRWLETDSRARWHKSDGTELVLASHVPGTEDYRDLRRAAVPIAVGAVTLGVAHPRDLLRIAEASPRSDEQARAAGLRALLNAMQDSSNS